MDGDMRALAERAVKCKGWRWLPGMLTQFGRADADSETGKTVLNGVAYGAVPAVADILPDFTDPATLGCLLALVRDAWGMHATVRNDSTTSAAPVRWWVQLGDDAQAIIGDGPTEAHALVAALEAAP